MQYAFRPGGATRDDAVPPLVSFKAGKCILEQQPEGDFLVTPDRSSGTIVLKKGNDNLMHFKWLDRSTGVPVDDFLVFPGEVQFKRVRTGKSSDRVYVLKWRAGDRRLLFWMQDKDSSEDTENAKKINTFINDPNAQQESGASASGRNNFMSQMLRMNQPQSSGSQPQHSNVFGLDFGRIMQDIQTGQSGVPNAAGSSSNTSRGGQDGMGTATPQTPQQASSSGVLSAEALQQAMAGISTGQSDTGNQSAPTDIRRVLNAEAVINTGILDDPEVRRTLISYLPESQQSDAALMENLRSPQFQQALDSLSNALQSENFNTVMANMGIDPAPGMDHLMRGDAIGAFLAAANAVNRNQTEDSTNTNTADGDSETKMDESN